MTTTNNPLDQMQVIQRRRPGVGGLRRRDRVHPARGRGEAADRPRVRAHVHAHRFAPNYQAPSHWHPSDTIYIITQGEFSVEGEGTYRPGDIRWVKGGTAYGSESAGPEGCEFYIVSMGPFDVNDPDSDAPPRGDWRAIKGV